MTNQTIKRYLSIVLSVSIVFSACACAKTSAEEAEKTGEVNTGSFSQNENTEEKNSSSDSSEKPEKYLDGETTIWIDHALDVTYEIPLGIETTEYEQEFMGEKYSYDMEGNYAYCTEFGSEICFHDKGGYIHIEKSVDDHTDLNTLHIDINKEKRADGRFGYYKTGDYEDFSALTFDENKNVRIGQTDTVAFHAGFQRVSVYSADYMLLKGYNFMFEGEPMSMYTVRNIYGSIGEDEARDYLNNNLDVFDNIMKNIIVTMKKYDGHSNLTDLGGNAAAYFWNGYSIREDEADYDSKAIITINYIPDGSIGVIGGDEPLVKLTSDKVEWNGDPESIFEASLHPKTRISSTGSEVAGFYDELCYARFSKGDDGNWYNEEEFDIVNRENVTYGGIDMIHYLLRFTKGYHNYCDVYTFVIDGTPYVFSNELQYYHYKDATALDGGESAPEVIEKNNDETALKMLLYNSRMMLTTLHILTEGESPKKYYHDYSYDRWH